MKKVLQGLVVLLLAAGCGNYANGFDTATGTPRDGNAPLVLPTASPTGPITLTKVSVMPAAVALGVGNSTQLTVNATVSRSPQDVTANATFASSDNTIANVTGSGVVNGVGPGQATISAQVTIGQAITSSTANTTVTVTNN